MAVGGTLTCSISLNESNAQSTFADVASRRLNLGSGGITLVDLAAGAAFGIKPWWTYTNPAFTGNLSFDLTALPVPYSTAPATGSPIVTLALVKAVYILWSGTDGQVLYFGPGASNPWTACLDSTTARHLVMPGSPFLISNLLAQASNPWTVDGTHKSVKIDAGANTAAVTLAILGA